MMKKDKHRFTIRFNPADPRQQMIAEMLEAAGRRKASLITDALYEYLMRYGNDGIRAIAPLPPIQKVIEPPEPTIVTNDIPESPPDDIRDAIFDGLSVFNM